MTNPPTIHDLGGFPEALFAVQYPAHGSPELATETQKLITTTTVELDQQWGLDHSAWGVVNHLYPNADVPVVELSLDRSMNGAQHYTLAKELGTLRDKGVLIIGSGNIVHDLHRVAWHRFNDRFGFDWTLEAQAYFNKAILSDDHEALINFSKLGSAADLAIPTPEHYLPLLYILALQRPDEHATVFNDKPMGGPLTMTSVRIEKA